VRTDPPASDCVERKRQHASRRDGDHRLSLVYGHEIGRPMSGAIPRPFGQGGL